MTDSKRARTIWSIPALSRALLRALSRPGPWKRGRVITALTLLLGLLLLLHAQVPDRGGLGSLVDTFLPWFGLFVPVLLAGALWRRSAIAVVAVLLGRGVDGPLRRRARRQGAR